MTVSSEINKSGPYVGNGATTVFPYTFRIVDASHVEVIKTVSGVDSTVSPSLYTLSGVGASSGSVVFLAAPVAGEKITIIRNVPFTQQTDLENQGAYYAETIEEALDLAVMRDQQLAEEMGRAVKLPVGASLDFDADELVETLLFLGDLYLGPKASSPVVDNNGDALKVGAVYWDTVSDQMFTWSGSEWKPTFLTGNTVRSLVTATGGQTVVTAPTYLVGKNTISVYLNGIKLVVGSDYAETNQNTITMTAGLTSGDEVEMIVLQSYPVGSIDTAGVQTPVGVSLARLDELRKGTVVDLLADTSMIPAVVPVGTVIEVGGARYQVAATGASNHQITTAGGVKLYVMPAQTGVTSYRAYADASSMTLDNTASIQQALASSQEVVIPAGQWRIDGTILLEAAKTITLNQGAWLARTTDTANTDPVIWMKGNYAQLRGAGRNSLIRSFNSSPDGVVKLGHASLTAASAFDVVYCDVSGVAIYGSLSLGATSGPADVLLHMLCSYGTPTKASYFHSVSNVLFAHGNVGLKMQGNSNGNIIRDLQFLRMGGNQIVGRDNAGLWLLGAKENQISDMFFNFCPNLRCIVLENDSQGGAVLANSITKWIAEPDTGGTGTSKGFVVVSCGVLNEVEGVTIGTTNDLGDLGNGWYTNEGGRLNNWRCGSENYQATDLTIRKQSAAIILDGSDVGGVKMSMISISASVVGTRFGASTSNSLEMVAGGFLRPGLPFHNLGDLGTSTQAFRRLHLGTDLTVAGNKVVGARGAAIPQLTVTATAGSLPTPNGAVTIANAATPTVVELLDFAMESRAKIDSILAAMRTHGLIAP